MGYEAGTHRAKGNGGGGQTDETSIASVWLVNSIGVLVTELLQYGLNPLVIFGGSELTYDSL